MYTDVSRGDVEELTFFVCCLCVCVVVRGPFLRVSWPFARGRLFGAGVSDGSCWRRACSRTRET